MVVCSDNVDEAEITQMQVELVTIGDELLRGETVNSNATWLGRELTDRGITVTRTTVVPDSIETIAETVNAASARASAVITTGGLGPTHDDRTMAAIATARGVNLVEHPEAIAWVETDTDRDVGALAPRTLELPEGSRFLPNEVGIAPGAVIDSIYVLPGVPQEMKAMFGHIADEFSGPTNHERVFEVAQPEREIASILGSVEDRFDVVVGSYPGETVRVRIVSQELATVEEAADWLRARVELA